MAWAFETPYPTLSGIPPPTRPYPLTLSQRFKYEPMEDTKNKIRNWPSRYFNTKITDFWVSFSDKKNKLTYHKHIQSSNCRPGGGGTHLALGRQRQVDFCESEASLVYRACSRTARPVVTYRNTVLKSQRIQIITAIQILTIYREKNICNLGKMLHKDNQTLFIITGKPFRYTKCSNKVTVQPIIEIL